MSTETIERPSVGDPALSQGDPIFTHIVKRDGLTEAYVMGSPVTALCGHVWVPARDHKKYPLCARCKEIGDAKFEDEGGADRVE